MHSHGERLGTDHRLRIGEDQQTFRTEFELEGPVQSDKVKHVDLNFPRCPQQLAIKVQIHGLPARFNRVEAIVE